MRGRRWYRFRPGLVIVTAFLLFAAACGDDDTPEPADTQAPAATEAAAPDTTEAMADEMAMTTDEPIKLGYISGGDADPFVFIVTESIREAAAMLPGWSCSSVMRTSLRIRRSSVLGLWMRRVWTR